MNANTEVTVLGSRNELAEKSFFKWELNFENVSSIRTPAFAPMKNDDTKFYCEVWFQRKKYERAETSMQLILRKLHESSVYSNSSFEFNVSVYYSDGSLYKDYKSDSPIELAKFTERTCIIISTDTKSYKNGIFICTDHDKKISNNLLHLKCQMVFFGHMISATSHYNNIDALQNMKRFTKNFETLYQSNELSDVSVQVGEKTFRSHKVVLAANSPVFKRMLIQDFQEAQTGVITISDFEPDLFDCFLRLLYTGELENKSFSHFKQLYSLSDKYDVEILKQECFKILTDSTLNKDQIDDVLEMAYQYRDDNLKKAAKQLLLSTIKKE